MARLIDANALTNKLDEMISKAIFSDTKIYYTLIRELIAEQPTIEAKTTQNAEWVGDTFCSNCNRFPVYQGMHISNQELANYFSYCPHCGAKIIRENNND